MCCLDTELPSLFRVQIQEIVILESALATALGQTTRGMGRAVTLARLRYLWSIYIRHVHTYNILYKSGKRASTSCMRLARRADIATITWRSIIEVVGDLRVSKYLKRT